MLRLRRSYRVALTLLFISGLLVGGLWIYVSTPHPAHLTDTVGGATISFEVSDTLLLAETECYTASWNVAGIESVYLNDNGKVGQGEQVLCFDDTLQPELKVELSDGSNHTYSFEIKMAQSLPLFWGVLTVAGFLFFISVYFFIVPLLGLTLRSQRGRVNAIRNLVGLILFTLIVLGIALELGLRFYFTNYGTEDERILYVYSSDELQQRTGQLVGSPYTTYLLNPKYEGHTSAGYRGEDVPFDELGDTFHIVAVGASTTYGFGLRDVQAYPNLLENILQDRGYDAQVTNAGIPGYTSYELLTNFQFRILEIEPDLVIYYGAKNDADTLFEDPGCYNDRSPIYGLTTFHGLWRTEFEDIPTSVLYRYFAVNAGIMEVPNDINFALEDIPVAKECLSNQTYTEEALLELNQPTFAERNMRNFIALAQFNDIEVAMAELVHPANMSQVYEDEEALIMSPPRAQAVEEVNALYKQVAADMDVPYLDTSEKFVIEPGMFWTEVHMTYDGTQQLAEIYADFLIENDLIPPPLETN